MNTHDFSERELEILKLVATGASNKEIALALAISPNTVKVHLRNIFAKANLASRTGATVFAIKMGLVENPQDRTERIESTIAAPTTHPLNKLWIILTAVLALSIIGLVILNSRTAAKQNLINPQERWSTLTAMPIAVKDAAVYEFDNQLFVIGGRDGQGVVGQSRAYDVMTKTWTALPGLPEPVSLSGYVKVGDRLYIIGGIDTAGKVINAVQVYEPIVAAWSSAAALPEPMFGTCTVAVQGKIYLIGGDSGDRKSDQIYEYDPATDRWTEFGKLPVGLANTGCAVLENRVLVFGGKTSNGESEKVFSFYPTRREANALKVEELSDFPAASSDFAFSTIAGNIFVFGEQLGQTGGYRYEPLNDQWEKIEKSPEGVGSGARAVTEGTNIHILGGELNGRVVDKHFSYQAIYIALIPAVSN